MRKLALQKYRRMRTLVGKIVDLAEMRNLKINMLVFNPRFNTLEEIWTDEVVKLEGINRMVAGTASHSAKKSELKIKSSDAAKKYKCKKDKNALQECQESDLDDDTSDLEMTLSDSEVKTKQQKAKKKDIKLIKKKKGSKNTRETFAKEIKNKVAKSVCKAQTHKDNDIS